MTTLEMLELRELSDANLEAERRLALKEARVEKAKITLERRIAEVGVVYDKVLEARKKYANAMKRIRAK